MPDTQKERLLIAINNKDNRLVDNIVAYFEKHPQGMEVLSEKTNGSAGHINFLKALQGEYIQKKEQLAKTDLLTTKHKLIAIEWECLLRSAIACLRRRDTREPFIHEVDKERQPTAYGVEIIKDFYDKFIEFEDILYGADRWYRDHVMHAYRVWLLGMSILISENDAGELLVFKVAEELGVDGFDERKGNSTFEAKDFSYSEAEVFSMWTIAALTHDLGYPLQKAPKLLRTIHEMMTYFVVAPNLKHDFRFNTAADSVNDYIVRLLSTKMVRKLDNETPDRKIQIYSGRIQPKYYVKFLKSLELNQHGIISSILLYKALVFFLESDCNLSEDYYFNSEEARQFYIRREILRAMASHTCGDIYLMYVTNLSFLLYISDELQEWGRNKYYEIRSDTVYLHPPIYKILNFEEIDVSQEFVILCPETTCSIDKLIPDYESIIKKILSDYSKYTKVFRDGIDTNKRTFSYCKTITIRFDREGDLQVTVACKIPKNSKASICYKINKGNSDERARIDKVMEENKLLIC